MFNQPVAVVPTNHSCQRHSAQLVQGPVHSHPPPSPVFYIHLPPSYFFFSSCFLCFLYCCWAFTISLTTNGSSRVDTSPRSSVVSMAIFLRIRLMIFPERVFGNRFTTWETKTVNCYQRQREILSCDWLTRAKMNSKHILLNALLL